MPRLGRRDVLRERVEHGYAVPVREQVAAVLAYAEWKLSGLPVLTSGFVPEVTEFLAPVHAAAVNAMTAAAVMGVCARLSHGNCREAARRAVLRELNHTGGEALRVWPGLARREPGMPTGLWPRSEDDDSPGAPAIALPPSPSGRTF